MMMLMTTTTGWWWVMMMIVFTKFSFVLVQLTMLKWKWWMLPTMTKMENVGKYSQDSTTTLDQTRWSLLSWYVSTAPPTFSTSLFVCIFYKTFWLHMMMMMMMMMFTVNILLLIELVVFLSLLLLFNYNFLNWCLQQYFYLEHDTKLKIVFAEAQWWRERRVEKAATDAIKLSHQMDGRWWWWEGGCKRFGDGLAAATHHFASAELKRSSWTVTAIWTFETSGQWREGVDLQKYWWWPNYGKFCTTGFTSTSSSAIGSQLAQDWAQ